MSLKKRLRFEIFKRDGFRCQYCGQIPPNILLQVDHIVPKSKGGKDEPTNLLTSCADCNLGKSNLSLKELPPSLKEQILLLRERERQLAEYDRFLRERGERIKSDTNAIIQEFQQIFPGRSLAPEFVHKSLHRFLEHLPREVIAQNFRLAACRFPQRSHDETEDIEFVSRALKYFCGICWNQIKGKGRPSDAQ